MAAHEELKLRINRIGATYPIYWESSAPLELSRVCYLSSKGHSDVGDNVMLVTLK